MAESSKRSMKLLIDTKSQRVVYAEVDRDVVELLFSILTLPMGTVIKLLTKQRMVGCLANIYESFENLSEKYIQPSQSKDTFLDPETLLCGDTIPPNPFLDILDKSDVEDQVKDEEDDEEEDDDAEEDESEAFVKGVVTYMVMDDLVVKPVSTKLIMGLLNKFNVKEVGDLEEKTVNLGIIEALDLLKASLTSKSEALTTVFLKNMGDGSSSTTSDTLMKSVLCLRMDVKKIKEDMKAIKEKL